MKLVWRNLRGDVRPKTHQSPSHADDVPISDGIKKKVDRMILRNSVDLTILTRNVSDSFAILISNGTHGIHVTNLGTRRL
jgi:hypothetical protein